LYTDKPPKQLQHLQSVKVVPAEQEEVRNGSDAHTTLGKTNTELIKRFLEPFFTGKPDSFSFGAMRSWDPEKKPDKHELLRIAGEIASHFPPQQVRHQYCAKSLVLSWPDGVNLAHADNKLPDELKVKTESNESSIFEVFPDKEYKWCDLIDHLQHEGIDLAWAEELTAVICEARHRAGRPGSHCIQQTFLYKGETYRPVLYRIDRSSTATEYHIILSKQPDRYYASRLLDKFQWYETAFKMLDEARDRRESDDSHWIMATSTYLLLPEETRNDSEAELRKTYFDKIADTVSSKDGPRYALLTTPAFSDEQKEATMREMHRRFESFNSVNCWCSNKVEIKRARMAGIDILITNRAVLFHVRTYVYHRREEARRVGIYIDSDKIAREFRRWFWDTFESDQAETIGDDEYSEWAIPPLAPKPDK
jgi:hypothetical protein